MSANLTAYKPVDYKQNQCRPNQMLEMLPVVLYALLALPYKYSHIKVVGIFISSDSVVCSMP
jgi:hypothetical protein